ncbi:uncharacterized protein PHACADRAFT_148058 [Phanerochaete carnosa HHB-10118-sp]|uniref:Uncharacterized protein n=1 Tax=Phanerochaete carnosa (strain HHB-10118-sp) TaxID=650164 RepID=K5UTZ8_PHACS|nr:uncharacterized protein PHACADRAFT_148058 [Phanerochaete carnosa HHB-10118-sp]EKM53451.1 hypothetical protein PHACADRAFT_148058 [Phanerochaete carnosa HHB-10118-sp]
MPCNTAYAGTARSLVLAIDVGTTFSGVSYAILDPKEVPRVHTVTRYPGQESGAAKVPSILYYSKDGTVFAAGAEAASPSMRLEAEDRDLVKVEWWKLHLCPEALKTEELRQRLRPLPLGKDVISIFADMLRYLLSCTRTYIIESTLTGESIWNSVVDRIEVVLGHPNGWEGSQQAKMRRAAIMAGLVPDNAEGHARVHFVTEGEASMHFCIERGLATHVLKDGETVIVVDAGGGTIDLTTYTFVTSAPIVMEEVAPPDCIVEGSAQVNDRAKTFLTAKLAKSQYGNSEDITCMIDSFETIAKPTFRSDQDRSWIRFGSTRDKDPEFGIKSGQLVLEGHELAAFFAPSIARTIDAIHAQRLASSKAISTVFLVGGFASSPWLYVSLQRALKDSSIAVCRPENHSNKAVAEGAVWFFLEHFVSVRVARLTYGTTCVIEYNPQDSDHIKRRGKAYMRPSGRMVIPNAFNLILAKGTSLREQDEVCSQCFYKEASSITALNKISTTIVCYRGSVKNPKWTDAEPERFSTLCTVSADTTKVKKERKKRGGNTYHTLDFKVVLLCGLTEFKAQISWWILGLIVIPSRGPAKIIYDDDTKALSR